MSDIKPTGDYDVWRDGRAVRTVNIYKGLLIFNIVELQGLYNFYTCTAHRREGKAWRKTKAEAVIDMENAMIVIKNNIDASLGDI